PGATNVLRTLGKGWGYTVFVLDVVKGLLPALAVQLLLPRDAYRVEWALAAGFVAVIGHCLSPFLKFKGGKGVATALGAVLGATPLVALCAFTVFAITIAATRIMSLSAMIGVASASLLAIFFRLPVV